MNLHKKEMMFSHEWDEALIEYRATERKKKADKRKKLLAMINDKATTENEKNNARKLLLKFE